MWQYTFTMPDFGSTRVRDWPLGYRPRSKLAAPDSEKTLWKYGSAFGKSIVDPRVTATTRGENDSCSWRTCACIAGRGPSIAIPFRYTTTLRISGAGAE